MSESLSKIPTVSQSQQQIDFKGRIGIIIPAFNPRPEVLEELLRRITRICAPYDCRVLVVDDGSDQAIEFNNLSHNSVTVLRHPVNRGKGAALKSGFGYFLRQESADAVITIDADLQHPPEKIPEFLEAFAGNAGSIITGYRQRNPRVMPVHRIVSNGLTSLIISLLTGKLVRDSQCGYRLISLDVLQNLPLSEDGFHLESEILIRAGWLGFKIASVPIPTIYNNEKSSIKNVPDTLNFVSLIFQLVKERLSG
ncbi:MAG: glycosyltransferase family 2 protein [Calditrichia bacterium]